MELAWLIPALSALAFLLIVSAGRFLPRHGAFLAPLALGAGFALFWPLLLDFLRTGPADFQWPWIETAGGQTVLAWGVRIDPLSVVMVGLVAFVALAIQVYSWEYMAQEPRFGWYFAAQALFAASMLALVLADNLLFLYIAWELVGLCSYLLIGFWYEKRSAAEAAKKAFITTRLGDVGLLVGILLLFKTTGTFDMTTIFHAVETQALSGGVVTAAAVLIFLGAVGKSAQFPLHIWLPDAMEGPTPVSALIHAATMVAAGVYLVARAFPLFEASAVALPLVASIGVVTALLAATMALVMTDLKRIIAYSTVTDLGLMMLALGAGGFTAAIFHLLAHGFSKALLFLGAGSISHSTGKTDIREMGGLAGQMPVTASLFTLAALSLVGVPPLAGFFSKDEVMRSVLAGLPPVFALLALAVFLLKGLYLGRALFTVFFGPPKEGHGRFHEAPLFLLAPMAALGLPSLLLGFTALTIPPYPGLGGFLFFERPEPFRVDPLSLLPSVALAVGGVAAAWTAYHRQWPWPARLAQRLPWAQRLWERKYYLDDLYQWAVDSIVLAFGDLVALFDRIVVNDTGVNGTGETVVRSGRRLRTHVTGKLYNYALGMALGVVAGALILWLLTMRG